MQSSASATRSGRRATRTRRPGSTGCSGAARRTACSGRSAACSCSTRSRPKMPGKRTRASGSTTPTCSPSGTGVSSTALAPTISSRSAPTPGWSGSRSSSERPAPLPTPRRQASPPPRAASERCRAGAPGRPPDRNGGAPAPGATLPAARSPRAQQAIDVAALPGDRPLVVAELPLTPQKLGGVELRAAADAHLRHHMVQELVKDDVLDEVPGHPLAVEHRVDADQPLDRAVAAELDGASRSPARRPRHAPPRDEDVREHPGEVLRVQLAKDLDQIVHLPPGLQRTGHRTRGANPMEVAIDVVADRL